MIPLFALLKVFKFILRVHWYSLCKGSDTVRWWCNRSIVCALLLYVSCACHVPKNTLDFLEQELSHCMQFLSWRDFEMPAHKYHSNHSNGTEGPCISRIFCVPCGSLTWEPTHWIIYKLNLRPKQIRRIIQTSTQATVALNGHQPLSGTNNFFAVIECWWDSSLSLHQSCRNLLLYCQIGNYLIMLSFELTGDHIFLSARCPAKGF